jgi:DNA invertase Pin-like site-specific DNA recombinase
MGVPVAYLRRSRVDAARPGVISYEQQLQAVRRLAAEHGDDPDRLLILEDWGKSGRAEKQRARGAFTRLEALIDTGEASAVYSYSISRLARSIEVLSRLARLCEQRGVPIRCAYGHSPDVSSATGRLITSILAAVEQWQAEWNAERMAEATAVR